MMLEVRQVVVWDADFDPPMPYYRNEADFNGFTIHDGMEVTLTGTASDGIRYDGISGTIDTVFEDCFKLWPRPPHDDVCGGKVWFRYENIETVTNMD